MTQHKTFKRRVRARMAKTGERYNAARRQLIVAGGDRSRTWVSEPESTDEAVRAATGRGWDEWCDVLDAWPGHDDGHTAIASYVRDELGVPGWWAQSVTLGYERITGRRLPHQRPDGTFTITKSRTIDLDAAAMRRALLDDDERRDLFPGYETTLRSRPSSRTLRISIGPGVTLFNVEPRDDGRVVVTVSHEQIGSIDEVDEWKHYWTKWLDDVADAAAAAES